MPVPPISAAAIFPSRDKRSFDEQRPEILEACKQFITTSHEEIRQRHAAGASGTEVVHQLSEVMDTPKARVVVGILIDNKAALQEGLRILRMSKGPKLVDALDSLLERSQQDLQALRSEIQTDEKWKSE